MNKALTDLRDLKSAFIAHCKELGCEKNYIEACEHKFDSIEKVLAKQDSINVAELEAPLVEHDPPKNYKYVHVDYKLNGVIVITPTNDPKKATSIEEINKLLR